MTTSSTFIFRRFGHEYGGDSCPKCNGGVMVQGFIIDWQGSKFSRVSNWVEGVPGKPSWFGTTIPVPAEKCIPVGTFRCSVCGFLESYAHPEFAAK